MLLTVDYGGTRTKLGYFNDLGQMENVEVFPSPRHHLDFFKKISDYYRGGDIALSLPGAVPFPMTTESVWQYGPVPRPESRTVSQTTIQKEFEKLSLPDPSVIIGDVTAAGFSVAPDRGDALIIQLSTGIAGKCYRDRQVVVNSSGYLLLNSSFENGMSLNGVYKSYYHWLRKEFRAEWLQDPSLDFRELAESNSSDCEVLAEIFSSYVLALHQLFPAEKVFLIGGGAVALQRYIEKALNGKNIYPETVLNADSLGLKGLDYLYRQGRVPFVLSAS